MDKAALPSLAASVLLHLALPLGIGGQVPSVNRVPLLPSKLTQLELVPMESAPHREASLAALALGSTKLRSVAERAAPPRRSALPSASVSPAPLLPTAASPAPASDSRGSESPSAESELARESTESAAVAAPSSVVEPHVAPPSVAPTGSAAPLSGTATGAALVPSRTQARGGAGAAMATPNAGGPAGSSGDAEPSLRAAYLEGLRRRVLGHRVYPYLARRARLQGTVCLRVSLNGRGEVARLQATCGAPESLLEAAFAAVRTAAPFGPLPSPLRELTVDLPMVFQLEAP